MKMHITRRRQVSSGPIRWTYKIPAGKTNEIYSGILQIVIRLRPDRPAVMTLHDEVDGTPRDEPLPAGEWTAFATSRKVIVRADSRHDPVDVDVEFGCAGEKS